MTPGPVPPGGLPEAPPPVSLFSTTHLPWRFLLTLVLALLAWRVTALALASWYVDTIPQRGDEAAEQALEWYPEQSAALYQKALSLIDRDAAAGTSLLERAYAGNPTEPLPLLALSAAAATAGDQERADLLMDRVAALRPTDVRYQQDLGQYWLERGRPEVAFRHWTQALRADANLGGDLFPRFRSLLANPAMGEAFAALALTPPPWWVEFFIDSARQLPELAPLEQLYRWRGESVTAPLTPAEHLAYCERLMREGAIAEAHVAWVNSLDATQRQQLAPLFNGGFELPLGGGGSGCGFNWQTTAIDRVEMARGRPEGENRNALRIRFRSLRVPFRHLAQTLLLGPGSYALGGISRGQSLLTEGGLRWEVRCLGENPRLLGDSERFFGAESWTPFRLEFEVPADCPQQEIRLVSANGQTRELLTDGELWFDDMQVRTTDALSPQARARIEAAQADATTAESDSAGDARGASGQVTGNGAGGTAK